VEQTDFLRYTIGRLEAFGVPYMVVGSFAGYAYGEPRFTQDIDLVVELTPIDIPDLLDAFPPPDFYVSHDAVRQAVRDRFQFNILHPTSGNKIDVMFPRADEWGRTQLGRRRRIDILPGLAGYVASPEDVIVGKLWYYHDGGSEKHLRDIAGILRVSGDLVDRAAVARWAAELGYTPIWQAVLDRLSPAAGR
jgi:hypothetical protein